MRHSYHQNKWHYCARCGDKTALSEMKWQNGVLLCLAKCVDTGEFPLVGQRDKAIAKLLSTYVNSQELQPDKMLTEASAKSEDEISFNI